jgi:NAD(P)-dependent dehydrogenase (short-subunit alcohol dehydrogenase family)
MDENGMRDFRDKVVLVTGAAGGLGRALCERFGAAGARVAATDVEAGSVEALAAELGGKGVDCRGYVLDVTDEAACQEVVGRVAGDFGGLDVLVNNAGITHRSSFAQTETSVFRRVMDVNFFGSLYCTKAALDMLIRRKGLIVVVSSVAGLTPLLGRTGYSAAKHALHGLFDSLRSELWGTGVGVTVVCPGFTATRIDVNALDYDGRPTKHPQSTVGRVATPEETAEKIFRAAARGKRLVVFSTVGKLSWLIYRIGPALFERLMRKSVGKELRREE